MIGFLAALLCVFPILTSRAHAGLDPAERKIIEEVDASMKEEIVSQSLPGTSAEIEFEEGYPAMAPTEGNKALFRELDRVSRDLGFGPMEMVDPMARGAADVSFASVYVPSLDGLGPLGAGDHSPAEWADLESLSVCTKRTAVLLYRLSRMPRGEPL